MRNAYLSGSFILFLIVFILHENMQNAIFAEQDKPNIVFILADDLGYGDIGAFGQQKIKTPNLDSLAKEGIRFTRHYAGNNVCAPSRAVLMTGMHPGHCVVRDNKEARPEGQAGFAGSTPTLVGELKKCGYATGAFGKWGLGAPDSESTPLRLGFDRFYGYNCQREAHTYYPKYLWDNDRKVVVNEKPIPAYGKLKEGADPNDPKSYAEFQGEHYSADLIADKVMEFVDQQKESPFFLYWATTVPHLGLQVPEDSLKEYQGLWDDPPYIGGKGYVPHLTPRATYAAMISRMDREIGRLVSLLKEKEIYENTIIVFTSDNGPSFGKIGGVDAEFFNSSGGLRGRKGSMYEGGIRVPCIVSWPGKVRSRDESKRITGFEDWMPTLLEIAGAKSTPQCDGIGFSSTILAKEEEKQPDRPFLYRESPGYGAQQTLLVGDWKIIRKDLRKAEKEGKSLAYVKIELYDLADDPAEKNDQAGKFPEKVAELQKIMDSQHIPSSIFPLPLVDPLPGT